MKENSIHLIEELEMLEVYMLKLRCKLAQRGPYARPKGDHVRLEPESFDAAYLADEFESDGSSANALEVVSKHIEHRGKLINALGADLAGDPVWSMLLELYAAELRGQVLCVKVACLASGVPATTALRWLAILEERGWVMRQPDNRDGRRVLLDITQEGRNLVAALL